MFNLIKRSGRLAGIYTTYAGMLFGATWLLDRWLVWHIQRDIVGPAFGAAADVTKEYTEQLSPLITPDAEWCSHQTCPNTPTTSIHGWPVCDDHKPRRGDTITVIPTTVKAG